MRPQMGDTYDVPYVHDLVDRIESLQSVLISMVYVHTCNCGDVIPEGQCARCRAVAVLGFDPAEVSA